MKEKIFLYLKQKKLLVILLSVYILLSLTCLFYIHYNGQQLVTTGSPVSTIMKKLGLGDPVPPPVTSTKNPSSSNSGQNNNGTSSSNDGTQSADDNNSSSNNLTAVVAFYADTQEDTDEEDANHTRVANYLLASGASTIFHAGDVMEDGTQNSMDRFAAVTEGLRSAKGFYPALGNNDRDGGSPSAIFQSFFSEPTHYSVNVGNLHLIILDSAFESMSPGSSQYNWLTSDLQSEAATSRIVGVMFHHPSSASEISSLLSDNHVDFAVSGHIHSYGQSVSGGVNYFTLSGQPAIGYILAKIYEQNVQIIAYDSGNGVIDSVTFDNR